MLRTFAMDTMYSRGYPLNRMRRETFSPPLLTRNYKFKVLVDLACD